VPSERCSIVEMSIEYCGWLVVSSDVTHGDLDLDHHAPHH
jgi:hypothetical protein